MARPLPATPFDLMDRDSSLTLQRTHAAAGFFDSDDIWRAPTGAPETIQGHISTVRVQSRESQYGNSPAGIVEKGTPRLYTETLLEKGDRVTVAQGGGITFTYRVVGLVRAHRLMAQFVTPGRPVRYEFELQEEPR